MITVDEYFAGYAGDPGITDLHRENAERLLMRVNDLLQEAVSNAIRLRVNPRTKTYVGGEKNGGWRPQDCPIGAPNSAHKQGEAVDVYDFGNVLDAWLTAHPELLEVFDLYREDPDSTNGWCHLSTRMPGSKKRTFKP